MICLTVVDFHVTGKIYDCQVQYVNFVNKPDFPEPIGILFSSSFINQFRENYRLSKLSDGGLKRST